MWDRLDVAGRFRNRDALRVGGHEDPTARGPRDQYERELVFARESLEQRGEIDVPVGDVEGEDGIATPQLLVIERESLPGQEVDGHRIAGERIQDEDVELSGLSPRQFSLHLEARIAHGEVPLSL